jgi:hypothetical protein
MSAFGISNVNNLFTSKLALLGFSFSRRVKRDVRTFDRPFLAHAPTGISRRDAKRILHKVFHDSFQRDVWVHTCGIDSHAFASNENRCGYWKMTARY